MSHGVELIMETAGHIVIRPSPTHYFKFVFSYHETFGCGKIFCVPDQIGKTKLAEALVP